MRSITEKEYQHWRAKAKLLTADGHGDKVLQLDSGKILKLFRRKRIISSALYCPYTKRFAENAALLVNNGIHTISDVEPLEIPSIDRTAVCYSPLPGESLRDIQESAGAFSTELISQFGQFVARLHHKGIYFRSMHLGNVVLTPQDELGLIDIADLRYYGKPLSLMLRLRNFKHTCRYPQDRLAMYGEMPGEKGFQAYWQAYKSEADELAVYKQNWLLRGLQKKLKSYTN